MSKTHRRAQEETYDNKNRNKKSWNEYYVGEIIIILIKKNV